MKIEKFTLLSGKNNRKISTSPKKKDLPFNKEVDLKDAVGKTIDEIPFLRELLVTKYPSLIPEIEVLVANSGISKATINPNLIDLRLLNKLQIIIKGNKYLIKGV
jgi:hypothetical protein